MKACHVPADTQQQQKDQRAFRDTSGTYYMHVLPEYNMHVEVKKKPVIGWLVRAEPPTFTSPHNLAVWRPTRARAQCGRKELHVAAKPRSGACMMSEFVE